MPTPPRTSLDAIVSTGRLLLESEGLESLTMQRVAVAVGVRAPSLYKHVRDRGDLIRLIGNDAIQELGRSLDAAASSRDPRRNLRAMAIAHRAFARAFPQAYRLLFARLPASWQVDAGMAERASEPIIRTIALLTSGEQTLEAARTVVAWAHGFATMELAGAFRLGGDVDRAFAFGLDRLLVAVTGGSIPEARGKA